jgi:branched-chain amino acid transport system substrate-binding protein
MRSIVRLLAFVAGLTVFCSAAEPIKVGVVMGLTGPWASIDEPAWKGIQLAVDQINARGGLLGRPVIAICIDTKADEAETVAAVTRLVEQEKVVSILGYCDTHWVLTGAPIATEHGIPFITPGATHPRIPERTGAWLACFGDNTQAAAMAEYAYKVLGLRKAAVWIDSACDFCVAVSAYFEDAWKHLGGEVVYEDFFETSWTDFSPLVARLKTYQDAGSVDCVYISAIPGNVGLIVKQVREGGVLLPILGEDGYDTPLLPEVAGVYAEGVLFTTHVSLDSPNPKVQEFVAAYTKKFGGRPENAFAALGYDAMMLLAEAINIVKSANPKDIEKGLSQIKDFPGVTGTISYPAGTKVPAKAVSVLIVLGGKFRTLATIVPEYVPAPELAK